MDPINTIKTGDILEREELEIILYMETRNNIQTRELWYMDPINNMKTRVIQLETGTRDL